MGELFRLAGVGLPGMKVVSGLQIVCSGFIVVGAFLNWVSFNGLGTGYGVPPLGSGCV